MALTFTRVSKPDVVGSYRQAVTDVTMDNSYASGGEAVTPKNLGLTVVDYATCHIQSTSGGGVNVASAGYDPSTALLHVFDETPAEVASGADIATTVVRVVARGV
jgi:hypothetical protein